MFKTIVLALDRSEGSRRAIPLTVEVAQRDGARIVIAHVEEDIIGKGGGPIEATEEDIKAELPIEDFAAEAKADLIVVGTRGHSPIAGLLLGSVTQRLFHIARRPVLAVPPES